jgi:hypothetical protein
LLSNDVCHGLLNLRNVVQDEFEPRQLPFDLRAASDRQRLATARPQSSQRFAPVTAQRPVGLNTMQRQQALDPIDVGHPLLDQSSQLAMRSARILLLDARDSDEGARLPIAATPGLQRPQEAFRVDPIGFDAAGPTVDLEAGRVHHPTGDPALGQTALDQTRSITSMSASASPPPTRRRDTLSVAGSWIARSHVALLSSIATRTAAIPKS